MVYLWKFFLIPLFFASQCLAVTDKPISLKKEEMTNAVILDVISLPTPGELLAAINKHGTPNWQAAYRQPIPAAYTSRPQIALNLGGLIADGYLAIEAEDSQQVKNIGKDIITLAKALGVSQNVLSRGGSITEFAGNNEWSALKEELEATQNEVKLAMEEQHDQELIILVSLGAWARGTEIVSSWISENYSPANAKLLRQPAIVGFLRNKMSLLSEKVQEDSLVKNVKKSLEDIEQIVSIPPDKSLALEDVKKLKDSASELVKEISYKKS